MKQAINIILDKEGKFVEIENDTGKSLGIGKWYKSNDGYQKIRITDLPGAEPNPLTQKFDMERMFHIQLATLEHILLKNDHEFPVRHLMQYEIIDEDLKNAGYINEWLQKMVTALGNEVCELEGSLVKKHWSHDRVDYHNACIESVDILCFLINIWQILRLTPLDIASIWEAKNAINQKRQDEGYTVKNKNELDNRSIVVKNKNWQQWQDTTKEKESK